MYCPHCSAPVIQGAPYCTNCNFNFGMANYQQPLIPVVSNREKRYQILLIILAIVLVFDGIFWRVISKLSVESGTEIYDYIKPYTWLVSIGFGSLPLIIGLVMPKTTAWRLIFIIGGSLWLAFRMYDLIATEFFAENPFAYYEF